MYINLRKIRKQKQVSPKILGNAIGVNVQTYYKKEGGKLKMSLEEAKVIADKLEMDITEIFFDDERSEMEHNSNLIVKEQ
jgi:DNA-binding XRE family transcriptional regulator